MYSNVAGRSLDEPEFREVFEVAARLDVPILLHPTYPLSAKTVDAYALIPTLGFMFDTSTAALKLVLGGLYERHPDFKLIVPHVAGILPYLVGRIDYEASRFSYGSAISASPSEHLALLYADCVSVWPPAIALVTDFLGADRMMYGSDYPFWDPERGFEALAATSLDDSARAAISSGTADRIFRL
jgi:predicted TIM-barrel fold metal-dependent hydrolase